MTTNTDYKPPEVVPPVVAGRLPGAASTLARVNRRAAMATEVAAAWDEALAEDEWRDAWDQAHAACQHCGARGHLLDEALDDLAGPGAVAAPVAGETVEVTVRVPAELLDQLRAAQAEYRRAVEALDVDADDATRAAQWEALAASTEAAGEVYDQLVPHLAPPLSGLASNACSWSRTQARAYGHNAELAARAAAGSGS